MPCSCDHRGMWDRSENVIIALVMKLLVAKGEIDNLTMEQYLALTRRNQAPGVVKPQIRGNVNFEIKSQFMQELREYTFSGNKNDDTHEHVERVLDIVSLFNIPGVLHDAVMLRIFPITLTGAATRWVDRLPLGTVDSWDLLKKAFIQSNGAKYRVVPPGYYTRMDNRPPFGEKRPSLEELMNKHLEESTRRRAKMEEWVKKLQENSEINTRNQIDQCIAKYAKEKTPINNIQHEIYLVSNKCTQIIQENDVSSKVLPCQLPPKEINPGNFTLSCTIGSLNFYAMADLGANINVIPKCMFQHLKLDRLKKPDMLVEMADMIKRSHIEIVENVLVKIDKFLLSSNFMLIDMLNTHNETMILGSPFLATIHAKIYVFNKQISLGIGGDRVTYNMNKKIHNFMTSIGEIYMINSNNTQSDASSRIEKTDDPDNENDYCVEEQRWPRCDPNMKECNGGHEVYGMYEDGVLRKWFEVWCNTNPGTPTSKSTSIYENLNPRPKDNPFEDWLLTKVGHTNVSEPVKKTLLKSWLIDCFRDDVLKDPRERSFDDYKWMFDLEIDQLADEYDLGIKKGHLLDDIWENYSKVQGDNTYWWHDYKLEEEEMRQLGINIEEYDPPMVHVETFKVKRYSFDTCQSFICVTKELTDALPLGRENGSRFREMIRKELDRGRGIHIKT
ncbi:reverse transcriptase domain-containing protein [Tanacetum coccineum]